MIKTVTRRAGIPLGEREAGVPHWVRGRRVYNGGGRREVGCTTVVGRGKAGIPPRVYAGYTTQGISLPTPFVGSLFTYMGG